MIGSGNEEPQGQRIAIWGAGGHGRIILDVLRHCREAAIVCFIDDDRELVGLSVEGIEVVAPEEVLGATARLQVDGVVPAIGCNETRRAKFEQVLAAGLQVPQAVHPAAHISLNVGDWKRGVQVMAGVVVNTGAHIGDNVVLNTGCIIEHDCVVEDHCFVGPQSVLGGEVHIETGASLGIGTLVKPGVRIGAGTVTGVGAVVVNDIPAGVVAFGNPAQPIRAV